MIGFHRLLIGTAIVFSLTLAAWLFFAYRSNGALSYIVLSVSFLAAAGGLAYYLRNLNRFLGR